MNELIVASIIITVEFVIGYFLGRASRDPEYISDMVQKIKKKMDTTPVGAVRRPDAKQLARWKDPKAFEAEEAMTKTLREIPELNP